MASQAGSVKVKTFKDETTYRNIESVVVSGKFLTLRSATTNYHIKLTEVVSYDEPRRI